MLEEQLIPGGVLDPKVLEVMGMVPRHLFVEKGIMDQSYLDRPLTLGQGQTISQPLIVGIMTQALALKGGERVLEVGTGSGYQTTILSKLAKEVFTVERITSLSLRSRKILYRFGIKNVEFKIGDGSLGWPEKSPFDSIIVTAAAPSIPETLQKQMAKGGKLVIPVGTQESQVLYLVEREQNRWNKKILSECRFVKLVGKEGWSDGK